MLNQPTEKSSAERLRPFRLFVSIVMVTCPLTFILNAGQMSHSKTMVPVAIIYLAFLIVCGVLLALIAGQLYKQHAVREWKLDIGTMLLTTALISLPLGAANLSVLFFARQSEATADFDPGSSAGIVPIATAYFFLIIPVMFITEHILTWRSRRLKQRQSGSRQTKKKT